MRTMPLSNEAFNEAAFDPGRVPLVRPLVPKPVSSPTATVPIKCGIYGPQGSGKSTSAALMAAAISAQFYDHAPVFVVDPEAAWQFLKRRIFNVESIELIQRPFSTFKDMVSSLYEAEKMGACCWIVDPLTLIWNELLDSFKQKLGYIPIDKWQDVRQLWNTITSVTSSTVA